VQLAYQESKQKGERVAAEWEKKRQRARENGTLIGCRIPAWLEKVKGRFLPIPKRAQAVRHIFALAADGYGYKRIIATLHKEKIAPFGNGEGSKWNQTYIHKILNDRRTLGELTPKLEGGQAAGGVIANYYPAIVPEDLYLLARAGQAGRRDRGHAGPRDATYVNTFQSMLFSALDGEPFHLANKASKTTAARTHLVLVNGGAAAGRAAGASFPYFVFESAILDQLREISAADVLPQNGPPNLTDKLRGKLAQARDDIAALKRDLSEAYSRTLADVLREREAAEEKLAAELLDALSASARTAERAWEELPSLVDLIREHGDEARLKVRTVLRSIVQEGRLLLVRRGSWTLAAVQFHFTGDAVRHYLVVYQAPAYRRPGGLLGCCSLATVAKQRRELDLRRRDHTADLAELLGAVSLETLSAAMQPA
jgi:hypothetical protein